MTENKYLEKLSIHHLLYQRHHNSILQTQLILIPVHIYEMSLFVYSLIQSKPEQSTNSCMLKSLYFSWNCIALLSGIIYICLGIEI